MYGFMQLVVNPSVSDIKVIVSCRFEIFFRDMLDEQLNKINLWKSSSDEEIIFLFVVMKGYVITIIKINHGKGDGWVVKVAVDILGN